MTPKRITILESLKPFESDIDLICYLAIISRLGMRIAHFSDFLCRNNTVPDPTWHERNGSCFHTMIRGGDLQVFDHAYKALDAAENRLFPITYYMEKE